MIFSIPENMRDKTRNGLQISKWHEIGIILFSVTHMSTVVNIRRHDLKQFCNHQDSWVVPKPRTKWCDNAMSINLYSFLRPWQVWYTSTQQFTCCHLQLLFALLSVTCYVLVLSRVTGCSQLLDMINRVHNTINLITVKSLFIDVCNCNALEFDKL